MVWAFWLLSLGISGAFVMYLAKRCARLWTTSFVYMLSTAEDHSALKSKFLNMTYPYVSLSTENPHANAARRRTMARTALYNLVRSVGKKVYAVSKSNKDVRERVDGSRPLYTLKDLSVPYDVQPDTRHHIPVLIDVDFHMSRFEIETALNGRPALMSTILPRCAAGFSDESKFNFNAKGEYCQDTSGKSFTHGLWDWYQDDLLLLRWVWFLPIGATIYCCRSIEVAYTSELFGPKKEEYMPHRVAVLLEPKRHLSLPALIATWALVGLEKRLTRLNVIDNDFVVMKFSGVSFGKIPGQRGYVSIGRPGTMLCANIAEDVLDSLVNRCLTTKEISETYNASVVSRENDPFCKALSPKNMTLLVSYIEKRVFSSSSTIGEPSVPKEQPSIKHYNFGREHKGVSMFEIMPAFDLNCYAPVQSRANDKESVNKRLNLYTIGKKNKIFSQQGYSWARTFREFIVADIGTLSPASADEVYSTGSANQKRNFQRMNKVYEYVDFIKTFMKRECYQKPKPPRIITPSPDKMKADYSKFTKPMSSACASALPFYGPCNGPGSLANSVVRIVEASNSVIELDGEKLDANLGHDMQMIYLLLMMDAFPGYEQEIADLHENTSVINCRTGNGVSFKQLALGSGWVCTSIMGTMSMALLVYGAYIKKGLSPENAYLSLKQKALIFGDDALVGDLTKDDLEKSSNVLGLHLKVVVKEYNEPVCFLNRIFPPNVWHGSVDSICDVPRQLSKLHSSTHRDKKDDVHYLAEKLNALYVNDASTPFIGEICRKYRELYHAAYGDVTLDTSQYFWASQPGHWPNGVNRDWAIAYVAEAYGDRWNNRAMDMLNEQLSGMSKPEDFFKPRAALFGSTTPPETVDIVNVASQIPLPSESAEGNED
jgi:hypothetical protein